MAGDEREAESKTKRAKYRWLGKMAHLGEENKTSKETCTLSHLIFKTTLWHRHYYYHIDEY